MGGGEIGAWSMDRGHGFLVEILEITGEGKRCNETR